MGVIIYCKRKWWGTIQMDSQHSVLNQSINNNKIYYMIEVEPVCNYWSPLIIHLKKSSRLAAFSVSR